MELQQVQRLRLTQHQLQGLALLQMSAMELDAFIRELSLENPMIDVIEHEAASPSVPEDLLYKLKWLAETDSQNRYYWPQEELDPLMRIRSDGGFEETLVSFLRQQLGQKQLPPDEAQAVIYLIFSLDPDGYLRVPLQELAADCDLNIDQLRTAKEILCSFDPPGVGAANLSECLLLQLDRLEGSELAGKIVRECLSLLARGNLRAIGKKLNAATGDINDAVKMIRNLNPRPGAGFQDSVPTQFIQPDLYVVEEDGVLKIHLAREEDPPFLINQQYINLLKDCTDAETQRYLTAKLDEAESTVQGILQRRNTVLRCAEKIVEHQSAFFRNGAEALCPLCEDDLAKELGISCSTVSRAIRAKYLSCSFGIFPLSYFFMRNAGEDGSAVGNTAARALLCRLIREEDAAAPLSDQKLCNLMRESGCLVSRRTIASYRSEMHIPSAHQRKRPE